MKKLFKTFAVLTITTSLAFAKVSPESTFKVGVYNVKNTHKIKVFVEKDNLKSLAVEILDENGRSIQKEIFGKDKTKTGLDLDLSQLEDGKYTLKISDKKGSYKKDLELRKEKKEELKIVI